MSLRIDNRSTEACALEQSDFPPAFWMASGSKASLLSKKKGTLLAFPLAYPAIVGVFVTVVFLMQRYIQFS